MSTPCDPVQTGRARGQPPPSAASRALNAASRGDRPPALASPTSRCQRVGGRHGRRGSARRPAEGSNCQPRAAGVSSRLLMRSARLAPVSDAVDSRHHANSSRHADPARAMALAPQGSVGCWPHQSSCFCLRGASPGSPRRTAPGRSGWKARSRSASTRPSRPGITTSVTRRSIAAACWAASPRAAIPFPASSTV